MEKKNNAVSYRKANTLLQKLLATLFKSGDSYALNEFDISLSAVFNKRKPQRCIYQIIQIPDIEISSKGLNWLTGNSFMIAATFQQTRNRNYNWSYTSVLSCSSWYVGTIDEHAHWSRNITRVSHKLKNIRYKISILISYQNETTWAFTSLNNQWLISSLKYNLFIVRWPVRKQTVISGYIWRRVTSLHR